MALQCLLEAAVATGKGSVLLIPDLDPIRNFSEGKTAEKDLG